MIPWGVSDHRRGTWGDFWARARSLGVTMEAFSGDGRDFVEFRRVDGEVVHTLVLPDGCSPDRKMPFRRMNHGCTRLGIPEFGDWPIEF